MGALMENLHDLFEAVFEEQDMQLVVEAEVVTNMTGDEALLTQALVNGLENVLAHGARAGSTVTLDLQDAGDAVMLSLADQGPGIAAADRTRAVERFVRLDESRSGDGTGLGLSLISAICHHHGGTLMLDDNAPGLRLPAYSEGLGCMGLFETLPAHRPLDATQAEILLADCRDALPPEKAMLMDAADGFFGWVAEGSPFLRRLMRLYPDVLVALSGTQVEDYVAARLAACEPRWRRLMIKMRL